MAVNFHILLLALQLHYRNPEGNSKWECYAPQGFREDLYFQNLFTVSNLILPVCYNNNDMFKGPQNKLE